MPPHVKLPPSKYAHIGRYSAPPATQQQQQQQSLAQFSAKPQTYSAGSSADRNNLFG